MSDLNEGRNVVDRTDILARGSALMSDRLVEESFLDLFDAFQSLLVRSVSGCKDNDHVTSDANSSCESCNAHMRCP